MFKGIAVWLFIGLSMILLFNLINVPPKVENMIKFSDFLERLDTGQIQEVVIKENSITGIFNDGITFKTYATDYPDLIENLMQKNVQITAKPPDQSPWYISFFFSWGPIIFLVLVWVFFMRQMQGGGNKALSFGKARAKLVTEKEVKVTFNDVAGVEEAKEEVQEIIEFLRDPLKFSRLGGKIPKGVLLVGPPGTGKTLLARAIAGEASVPFYSMSGSDFVEMFVGVGASRVRDLFAQAKKSSPCIIFIDEIDAVGRHRGAGLGGGHDEREQTLNQLLVEMDGFEGKEGVIIIAATNRPDVLDPALLRPGRFDRQVTVPLPDIKGREQILEVHTREVIISKSIQLSKIAKGTPGFSGADLANLVNEAALQAARKSKDQVEADDLEEAKDKVLMGAARKSMIISDKDKKNTAYHEAGHTLVALMTDDADPVHKVTIIPRGRALGVTQQLPEDDRYTHSKHYLLGTITVLMGGRAAEEVALKQWTTGAGNDLERATDIARKMVMHWGMGDALGPVTFGKSEEHIFLGKEFGMKHNEYSEKMAEAIDAEVSRIVKTAYKTAKNMLTKHSDALDTFANALLERETLNSDDINELMHPFGLNGAAPEPPRSKKKPAGTKTTSKSAETPEPASDTASTPSSDTTPKPSTGTESESPASS